METTDSVIQKRTRVTGFKEELWKQVAIDTMRKGLYCKFTQNPDLKSYLLNTENKVLYEANPHDRFWGIGLDYYAAHLTKNDTWGENHLGQLLMNLREELRTTDTL